MWLCYLFSFDCFSLGLDWHFFLPKWKAMHWGILPKPEDMCIIAKHFSSKQEQTRCRVKSTVGSSYKQILQDDFFSYTTQSGGFSQGHTALGTMDMWFQICPQSQKALPGRFLVFNFCFFYKPGIVRDVTHMQGKCDSTVTETKSTVNSPYSKLVL